MQTVHARRRATLSVVRCNPTRVDNPAAFGLPEPPRADIVRSAPHDWALLADIARMAGDVERAEELIGLAYLAYDMLGPDAWDPPIDFEDEEGPSDISVTGPSVFA